MSTPERGRQLPAVASRSHGRRLSLTSNSLALIGAKVAAMGLGFVFWVLAARLFSRADVGLAAGAVSAMMLCTQLATLGLGSAVISHYPEHRAAPSGLLNAACTMVVAAAGACAALFVLLATEIFAELDTVGSAPGYIVLFAGATVFGTLWILLDQISITIKRGDQALVRGLLFGGCCVITLLLAHAGAGGSGWELIFAPWVLAGLLVCAVGVAQLRASLPGWRSRPQIERPLARVLLRSGASNWSLTMAERTPGLVLPVVVTELLSPQANAVWYAAWMMAWVVYFIPIQVGLTLFAELVDDPDAVGSSIRRGIGISLALGLAGAVVVLLAANLALSVLGSSYADDGAAPLRILVLAVLPFTFVQAYFASCRAARRLLGANVVGWLGAALSVGAAAVAGAEAGLEGMAVAWVVSQYALGAWALWRLWRLRADLRASRSAAAAGSVTEVTPGLGPA